jgi:acyl-CoA thioester hydrolase
MVNSNAPRVRTEVQVMFFDTDCGGVVSNIAYLRFIEIARTNLAEELGLHLAKGWLDRIERARFWCGFRIVRPHDDVVIAECRQMLALIEMPAGKLLRLPESWDKYRALQEAASGNAVS